MPNGDPRVGFFCPTLTLMTDSYIIYRVPLIITYQFNSEQNSL